MSQRENLRQIAADRGESLANLSALIGRNAAYLQQFVARGSPKPLADDDRLHLAKLAAGVVRLVSRKELRTMISVALSVLRPAQQRSVGLVQRSARDDITDDLVDRIMGKPESETVILQPDLVGSSYAAVGKWDVDEPHPHPDLRRP